MSSAEKGSPRPRETARAIREWTEALGADNVVTDAPSLAAAESATFATRQRVVAILRPKDRSEVQACVRVANATGVPVYPVSRGRNWGYGSRVPPVSNSAVLDLS